MNKCWKLFNMLHLHVLTDCHEYSGFKKSNSIYRKVWIIIAVAHVQTMWLQMQTKKKRETEIRSTCIMRSWQIEFKADIPLLFDEHICFSLLSFPLLFLPKSHMQFTQSYWQLSGVLTCTAAYWWWYCENTAEF